MHGDTPTRQAEGVTGSRHTAVTHAPCSWEPAVSCHHSKVFAWASDRLGRNVPEGSKAEGPCRLPSVIIIVAMGWHSRAYRKGMQ